MPFRLARVAWGSEALKKSSRREGQDGPEASGKACGGAGALSVVVEKRYGPIPSGPLTALGEEEIRGQIWTYRGAPEIFGAFGALLEY